MLKPKKQVRVNGQLVETSEEELNKLSQSQGLPAAPITPVGAASVGASPDAVKMAGSRQQAAPATIAAKAKDTLAGAQRLDQPREQQSAAEAQAGQKAQQLQGLSGLDTRIQALVGQQLNNLQTQATTGPQFNQAQMDTLAPLANKTGIEGLLGQYYTANQTLEDPNLTPEQRTQAQAQAFQAMAALKNEHGIANPDDYIDVSQSRIGTAAGQGVVDPADVKVGGLDLSQLGFSPEQMDELVGTGWQELSVGQFQQKVKDLQQAEFQRIQGLRAQLSTLAPGSAQREAILRELGDAAQVGVTGSEQQVQELVKTVNIADEIDFGGKKIKVEKLLADERVSEFIAQYLNPSHDPEFKKKLEAQYPGFVEWINSNKEALSALSAKMSETGAEFGEVQKAQAELAVIDQDISLNDDVMAALVPGWGDATASVADLSGNGAYSLLKSDIPLADKSSITNKLNSDPELVAQLDGMSADEILQAHQAAERIDGDGALSALIGGDYGNGFLLDPEANQKLAYFGPMVEKMRGAGDKFQTLLEDPKFLDLMDSGELNAQNLDAFMKNPNAFKEYSEYRTLVDQFEGLENAQDIDGALQFLFGDDGVSERELSKMAKATYNQYMLNPSDPDVAARHATLQRLFGSDFVLSSKEKKSLFDTIRKGLGGGNVSLDHAIGNKNKGLLDFSTSKDFQDSAKTKVGAFGSSSLADSVTAALAGDKKVTTADLLDPKKFTDDVLNELYRQPDWWLKHYKIPSRAELKTARRAAAHQARLAQGNKTMPADLARAGLPTSVSKLAELNNRVLSDAEMRDIKTLQARADVEGWSNWSDALGSVIHGQEAAKARQAAAAAAAAQQAQAAAEEASRAKAADRAATEGIKKVYPSTHPIHTNPEMARQAREAYTQAGGGAAGDAVLKQMFSVWRKRPGSGGTNNGWYRKS